ncbi:MAG: DUF4231 domain-containing protein [Granulosicoccus sp.]
MTDDVRKSVRLAYAETLSEFNEQRAWYSKRAGDLKAKAQRLDLLVIALGASIAAIPVLKADGEPTLPDIVVSFLGVAVAVAQAAQRIYRYAETWPEYRLASERMKREYRLFSNCAPPYTDDDDIAQGQLVVRLEEIIAQEQKIFFDRARGKESAGAKNG